MKYIIIITALFGIFVLSQSPVEYINTDKLSIKVLEVEANYPLPKIDAFKSIEINLTNETINLWRNGYITETLPIAYQAREGIWFQSPTGYFKVGIKDIDRRSSLSGVNMPYSVQFYEDYFIHDIPFYDDGVLLTSAYSGGCLRLETEHAKKLFNFAEKDMPVTAYTEFGVLKEKYHAPVDLENSWMRQRFNNPIKNSWNHGGDIDRISEDYIQHVGVDFAGSENVYAIADGVIVGVWENGEAHGLGNTMIIKHKNPYRVDKQEFYAVYAHMDTMHPYKEVGDRIIRGRKMGEVGNTGYGCNYWRIGEDGCDSENPPDNHLHFEIKDKPVLENPSGSGIHYGYTPSYPTNYGYQNPMKILFE